MGDVVNLNKHRKARGRLANEQRAGENRLKFGRSKADKAVTMLEAERIKRGLDQTKLSADAPEAHEPEPAKPSK